MEDITITKLPLNSNEERKIYWDKIVNFYGWEVTKKAISTLDPKISKVLKLYYKEGYSFSEIAGLLNCSISTVRNYQSKGMYKLYRYFNPRQMDKSYEY